MFLCFCIISTLLGLGLIVIYGYLIGVLWDLAVYIPVQIAIASILLTLGISEVVTGIWSAVCCCRSCCTVTPSELVSLLSQTLQLHRVIPKHSFLCCRLAGCSGKIMQHEAEIWKMIKVPPAKKSEKDYARNNPGRDLYFTWEGGGANLP